MTQFPLLPSGSPPNDISQHTPPAAASRIGRRETCGSTDHPSGRMACTMASERGGRGPGGGQGRCDSDSETQCGVSARAPCSLTFIC